MPLMAPLMEPVRLTFRQGWRYQVLKVWAKLLLMTGQQAAALPVFALMLQLQPASRYALASQAHGQMQLHLPDAAIVTLQRLTALAGTPSERAAAWFNLGFALQQTDAANAANAAGEAFQKALALDARLDQAWYGLGLVRMAQQQFSAAVEAFESNTRLQPLSPHGWYRLVQAWLALGEIDKATRLLAHLHRFEPRVAAQLERENTALQRTEQQELQPPIRSIGTSLKPEADPLKARHAAR